MSRGRKKDGALVVALIIMLVFSVGLIFRATNGFSDDVKSFALRRNGKELILNNASGLSFSEAEQFEIVNMSSAAREFSVRVYARSCAEASDFEYVYGAEPGYSWNAFAAEKKQDFTSCFDITLTENRITMKHAGFLTALARYDSKIVLPSEIPPGDRFTLEVTVGNEKIELGFSLYERVTGVTLNSGSIVF